LKNIINESDNADLKGNCENCLKILRAFSKNNKENPCETETEMSKRLQDLYKNVQNSSVKNYPHLTILK